MDNIKNNKNVIIICIILVLIAFLLYLFSLKSESVSEVDTENYEYLKNYKSNEFVPVYITEEDIAKKYLNEYKNNMLYDVNSAYNSLNKEYREKKFGSVEKYQEYVSSIINITMFSLEVDKYSINHINGYKIFNIYDKSGNQYIFKEISIMNYEVYLDDNTVNIK